MDGELGMWQMEVQWLMSMHVRDTFDRGVCCVLLLPAANKGRVSRPGQQHSRPQQQHQQLFSFSKKVLTSSTESAFFRSGH